MNATLVSLSLALLLAGQAGQTAAKPNPLAPSLPLLSDEEEARIDAIINKFILFDLGKLPAGEDAKKVQADFQQLKAEAFFALIRGMNKSLDIEGSCPAVQIGKKLLSILRNTNDPALLDFARENIGIGLQRTPHLGIVKELRTVCILRKREVGQGGVAGILPPVDPNEGKIVIRPKTPAERALAAMPLADLIKAATNEKGAKQKELLTELGRRTGDEASAALAKFAAAGDDSDLRLFAFELLVRNLGKLQPALLKEKLKDEQPAVRAAAATAAGEKKVRHINELITLLNDAESEVRQSARKALTQLSAGQDFGPEVFSTLEERAEAAKKWQEWWAKAGN